MRWTALDGFADRRAMLTLLFENDGAGAEVRLDLHVTSPCGYGYWGMPRPPALRFVFVFIGLLLLLGAGSFGPGLDSVSGAVALSRRR